MKTAIGRGLFIANSPVLPVNFYRIFLPSCLRHTDPKRHRNDLKQLLPKLWRLKTKVDLVVEFSAPRHTRDVNNGATTKVAPVFRRKPLGRPLQH